jgi:5'-nucleotidase
VFTHAKRRRSIAAGALLGLVAAPLAVFSSAPASADVSSKIAAFPYSQPWSNGGLITATDNWSGVTGVQGYRGDDLITATGVNPQTVVADGSASPTNVIANSSVTSTTGGIHEIDGQTIAMQGSGTADIPHLVFRLDLSGQTGTSFAFDALDLDASADNAIQQIAVQYRVGASGNYTDLPLGFIEDATTASAASQVTSRDVSLPAAVDGQADVFVRVVTTNAAGNDELVGIDNIVVSSGDSGPVALSATDPGDKTATTGQPITAFTLAAAGGTTPYSWSATGLPPGVSIATNGDVSGTPTAPGVYDVTATMTDSATPTPGTAQTSFTITVTDPGAVSVISAVQGPGAASPVVGNTVTVEAVVTSVITANDVNDGFFLQEEDADADSSADTSEGVYVFCRAACPTDLDAGDRYRVSGVVAESNSSTQITATPGNGSLTLLGPDAPLPTAAVVTLPASGSTLNAGTFENVEGMRTRISTTLAVSEYFNQARFGEIVLTAGERPYQFTQTNEPSVSGYNEFLADLATRRIVLDDDSNSQNAATSGPLNNEPYYYPTPGLGTGNFFRGGDTIADLTGVFEYSFGAWKLRPVAGADYSFEPTNPRTTSPADVGGRLKVASFNVLNYFATIDTTSTDSGICGPTGDDDCRGADSEAERVRQLDKIVAALKGIDADVFGLIEIQNDTGLATEQIVNALNAATAPGTYDYIDTGFIGTDAIKQAFLYKTATVDPVGDFELLTSADNPAFVDTRNRPALIQTFDEIATGERVTVTVNHLKSKGSGCGAGDDSPADGSGNCDGTRTAAAEALADFLATDPTGSGDPDFLVIGDLNSYSQERPITALEDGGYVDLLERFEGLESYGYLFDGQLGHLDHALATTSLDGQVTGAGGWKINADENPLFDYNDTVADTGEASFDRKSTAVQLFAPDAFRSSDHDPVIVGLDLGTEPVADVEVQVLATNDFHGRLLRNGAEAGAAVLAGAVKQLRAANPATSFVAAGDLIGASTFESFIANDKPTIDVLNEAGLDVSAVGNHEFDQGYDDLIDRVIAEFDEVDNPEGGAEWTYLGANVRIKASGSPALDPSLIIDQGGVQVGYVGAVTEDLPSLVAPDGIAEIEVTDVVAATNAAADDLVAEGADVVVLLVHEGAPSSSCTDIAALGAGTDFGSIVQGVNDNVDAIVSGHTHLAYNCSFPVAGWSDREVTERPVVSAGQYGTNLNQLVFTVDPVSGEVQAKAQELLPLVGPDPDEGGPMVGTPNYPVDGPTKAIVDAAVADAVAPGAVVLGQIDGAFNRARINNAANTENRGGESTLGNLVAEIQQDATEGARLGSAQIAFMNPGGLRQDLVGQGGGVFPRDVTFRDAANVQPFANTLVNQDLTGAQIKAALEQQWQPAGASRPFLKLGISEGFTYTYDADAAQGERVLDMFLDGEPIDLGATYSVTVNSFLATGGDNFSALNGTARKQDTGVTDLQAQVDYFDEFASAAPLPVDYSQRAVGVDIASTEVDAGEEVTFGLSSLSMTGAGDLTDSDVEVSIDGDVLGTFPVTTVRQTALPGFDEAGTASVTITVPADALSGDYEVLVRGVQTGTEAIIPITVTAVEEPEPEPIASSVRASAASARVVVLTGTAIAVAVDAEGATPTGEVELAFGETVLRTATLTDGTVLIPTGRFGDTGIFRLTVRYLGDGTVAPSSSTVTVRVVKQTPNLRITAPKQVRKNARPVVKVALNAINATPTGQVVFQYDGKRVTKRLTNGTTRLKLARITKKKTVVRVTYRGDGDFFNSVTKRTTIRIR